MNAYSKILISLCLTFTSFTAFGLTVDEWMTMSVQARYEARDKMTNTEKLAMWNRMTVEQQLALAETNAAYDALLKGNLGAIALKSPYSVNQWITKSAEERYSLRTLLQSNGIDLWSAMTTAQQNAMTVINRSFTPPNPQAPKDLCADFTSVIRADAVWGDYGRILSSKLGGFIAEGVFVVAITIPLNAPSYSTDAYTTIAEYQGPPMFRVVTLSKQPCDFRNVDTTGASGPLAADAGTVAGIRWNVNTSSTALVPGQTYYFNARNWYNGDASSACVGGLCNASIATIWPH